MYVYSVFVSNFPSHRDHPNTTACDVNRSTVLQVFSQPGYEHIYNVAPFLVSRVVGLGVSAFEIEGAMGDKFPSLTALVGPLLSWVFAMLVERLSAKDWDVGRMGLRGADTRPLGADTLSQSILGQVRAFSGC